MEDMFEAIIGLIIIAASIIKVMNRGNKVKQNAPGKAAAPERPAAPAPVTVPEPIAPTVKPTIQPTISTPQTAAGEQESFWQQMSQTIRKELGMEAEEKDHGKQPPMNEGESRECGHGSVGGSMAYGAHEGGRPVSQKEPVRTAYDRKTEDAAAYRPAMNAEEMRRAVVMAEILKRPQERMAEQARRWSVR